MRNMFAALQFVLLTPAPVTGTSNAAKTPDKPADNPFASIFGRPVFKTPTGNAAKQQPPWNDGTIAKTLALVAVELGNTKTYIGGKVQATRAPGANMPTRVQFKFTGGPQRFAGEVIKPSDDPKFAAALNAWKKTVVLAYNEWSKTVDKSAVAQSVDDGSIVADEEIFN
jgi:hypothetical protein